MKQFSLGVLACFAIFFNASGQEGNLQRIEIEAKVNSDNYNIVAVGENGVLVFSELDEKIKTSGGKNRVWSVTNYDINFKEQWSDEIYITKKADLNRYIYKDGYLFALFTEKGKKTNEAHAIKLDVKNGDYKEVRGSIPFMQMNDFIAHEDRLIFGGNSYPSPGEVTSRVILTYCGCFIPAIFGSLKFKFIPLLYSVDFNRGMFILIDAKTDYRGSIREVQYSKEVDKFYTITLQQSKKKIFSTKLSTYNNQGKFEDDYNIKSKNSNILVNGKVVVSNENEKYLIGSFSKPKNEKKGKKGKWGRIESVEGLYFTKFSQGKQEFIKYYDFVDMSNYLTILKRSGRYNSTSSNMNKGDLTYLLLNHDVIVKDDEFIFVGESYFPQYHYEYYTDGQGNSHSKKVFDGYRYTHAIAAGFDAKGNLLWDHSFEIMDVLTFNLVERVKVMVEDDDVILAYSNGGYVQSKIIRGDQIVDGKTKTKLDTEFSSDKVKKNYQSDFQYWYDEYFLASGYQKIKSKKKESGDRKRKVFYFNKIGYK